MVAVSWGRSSTAKTGAGDVMLSSPEVWPPLAGLSLSYSVTHSAGASHTLAD